MQRAVRLLYVDSELRRWTNHYPKGESNRCGIPLVHNTKGGVFMALHKIRSGFMFGIAVIASPCCTPLIVPVVLVLLAGTPIAAWLSYHLSWVYGGLTMISIISFVLGFYWMRRKMFTKPAALDLSTNPVKTLSKASNH